MRAFACNICRKFWFLKCLCVLKDVKIDREHNIFVAFIKYIKNYTTVSGIVFSCEIELLLRIFSSNFNEISLCVEGWSIDREHNIAFIHYIKTVQCLLNRVRLWITWNICTKLWRDLSMYWRIQGSIENTRFPVAFIKYIKKLYNSHIYTFARTKTSFIHRRTYTYVHFPKSTNEEAHKNFSIHRLSTMAPLFWLNPSGLFCPVIGATGRSPVGEKL